MTCHLLKNPVILDPVTGLDTQRDILITDGRIEKIGENITAEGAETIDLSGMHVTPGLCDMHVHFREPGFEHKEDLASGAAAALAGGFTAVACMPNTDPCIDSAATVSFIAEKSRTLPIDIYSIGAVSKGRAGKELAPMAEMREAGVVGFSDDGSPVFDTTLLRTALEYASMFDVALIQHAEDPHLFEGGVMHEGHHSNILGLPGVASLSEETVIARDIAFTEYLKATYHVAHISTGIAAEAVRTAKTKGLNVTCEVTPHHFSLTDEAVYGYDTNTKMNPPLRPAEDVQAIKEALKDGTIDAIATDHAPHAAFEKEVEYVDAPFGIIGLETAVGLSISELVEQGYLTLAQLIEKLSTNPRRILRLPEIRIEEGAEANLTFLDTAVKWTVDANTFKSKSRNSPFFGRAMTGRATGAFVRNRLHFFND